VRKRPDLKIEGPIQYDAAVDMAVGKVKCQIQKWQDKPVLIFPDLNTGNNTYKAVQRNGCLSNWSDVTRIEQPVNDLSRGCTVDLYYRLISDNDISFYLILKKNENSNYKLR
jgi:phosphate acetyltransferase